MDSRLHPSNHAAETAGTPVVSRPSTERRAQEPCTNASTRRYDAEPTGLKTLATLTVLRTHVIKPLLAAVERVTPTDGAQHPSVQDGPYEALRVSMLGVFRELGIAA